MNRLVYEYYASCRILNMKLTDVHKAVDQRWTLKAPQPQTSNWNERRWAKQVQHCNVTC